MAMEERNRSSSSSPRPQRRPPPLDTCWGVPVAAAVSAFLFCFPSCSYGYLYVRFMEKFGLSREQAIWPQSALILTGGCAGLLVSQIERKFPLSQITMLGGFLVSTGLVASAFAPNNIWMTLTYGVIQGAGVGITMIGFSLYILLYFKDYASTATSMMFAGWAGAGLVGPPLTAYLSTQYGVPGSLLLAAALILHVLPIVMLIKHPRPVLIRAIKRKESRKKALDHNSGEGRVTFSNGSNGSHACDVQTSAPSPNHSPTTLQGATGSNLACFKMLAFYILLPFCVFTDYTSSAFTGTIVDHTVDKGSPLEDAKQILVYCALGQFLGRVILPFVSDKMAFNPCPVTVLNMSTAGVCLLILPHASAFWTFACLACILGLVLGYLQCMKCVLVAHYVGIARFSFCRGVSGLAAIPVYLSSASIIGFSRDVRGSYNFFYVYLAAANIAIAALLAMLALRDYVRLKRRKDRRRSLGDGAERERMNDCSTV
ncbi:monocarboxylate transporter 13-like [Haemaphysalis longicornis]